MRTARAVPGALTRFVGAMRIWISAVWQSGSRAAVRSAKALGHRIFAPIRLRALYSVRRFRIARPSWRGTRRVSVRVIAAGPSIFHGRPVLRTGMIGGGLSINGGGVARARVTGPIGGHCGGFLT